jgi:protease I
MPRKKLDGFKVAILAATNFEQSELTEPKQALEDAGAETAIISPKAGRIRGFHHDKPGDEFEVDMTLEQADPDDFDAVLLPGGALNADALRISQRAREFVRRIDEADKPIAVICHGPWLLISAGLTTGRTMTSYHTIQDDIRNAGAHWVDWEVVCDRNWVSSRQPGDIPAFNKEMIELFAEYKTRQRQPAGVR